MSLSKFVELDGYKRTDFERVVRKTSDKMPRRQFRKENSADSIPVKKESVGRRKGRSYSPVEIIS